MRILIGDKWLKTIEATSITITRSISDPVPTCTLNLRDDTSSYQPQALSEILILDTKVINNPTLNLVTNPTLNAYNAGGWVVPTLPTGLTVAQNGGGGATATLANVAAGSRFFLTQTRTQRITAGVSYCLSVTVAGSVGASAFSAYMQLIFLDANNTVLITNSFSGGTPPGTTPIQFVIQALAPTNAVSCQIGFGVITASGTNSGSVTFTNAQLEPMWFSDLTYPTAFCGPSQVNCTEVDDYYPMYIRQSRKFAGYVITYTADNYYGNARTWQLQAVGYAWLLSAILCNNTFTSQYDDSIIGVLMTQYFAKDGVGSGTFNLAQVIRSTLLSSTQSNWDDLRTILDSLAAQSGSYWTVDYYWRLIYQQPGLTAMGISLICDNSSIPNMTTTFPAYDFHMDGDFSQPGTSALVIGSGTNVSEVIATSPQTAALNSLRWVQTVNPAFFMRKINDSKLASTTDTNTRGVAEILQYSATRKIYHLTTNVELVPGQSIKVTSATDGLSATSLVIQSVTGTWLGTDETLTDVWQYQSGLGAVNRKVTSILNRIFRATQSNSSAPAISSTVTLNSAYQTTILGDGPLAFYPFGDTTYGAVADASGHGHTGALNGNVALNVASLITKSSSGSMRFDGSSGYVALPFTVSNGLTAFTMECWVKFFTLANGNARLMANSHADFDNSAGFQLAVEGTSGGVAFPGGAAGTVGASFGTGSSHVNLASTSQIATGNIYYLAVTWDGATITLYFNGTSQATAAWAGPFGTSSYNANIGRNPVYAGDYVGGIMQNVAFYSSALTGTQISNHYTVGTS